MHELARLARCAFGTVLAHDEHLGVRNRLADRRRPTIDLLGRQVGRSEGLGEAVHQVRLRARHAPAQLGERGRGHRPARVREVAKMRVDRRRPVERRELDPQRRHGGEPRDALTHQRTQHVLRQQVVVQHRGRTHQESGRQLRHPVVEGQRQHREDAVFGSVAEIGRDAVRALHDVPVREHDALRTAGAAGRVEDRRHVHVEHARHGRAVVGRGSHRVFPACDPDAATFVRGGQVVGAGADDDHVAQIRPRLVEREQARGALRGRHQDLDIAVARDVGGLLGLEQRVDRHEDRTSARSAPGGDDRFGALLDPDTDARGARNVERTQRGGETPHLAGQFGIRKRGLAGHQGGRFGTTVGRPVEQVGKQF